MRADPRENGPRLRRSDLALLTVMKGLPLAYNKDMQEDKEAFFDAYDTVTNCLNCVYGNARDRHVSHWPHGCESAKLGFTNATDLADYLVGKGHAVSRCAPRERNAGETMPAGKPRALEELSLAELKPRARSLRRTYIRRYRLTTCVSRRNLRGGPAPEAVEESIGLPSSGCKNTTTEKHT